MTIVTPRSFAKLFQRGQHVGTHGGAKGGERFVQQQNRLVPQHATGKRDPLPLAAGQGTRLARTVTSEPDLGEGLFDTFVRCPICQSGQAPHL